MKIAFASEGKSVDALISEKGGRAPYILIFEDGALIESIKNPFAVGSGGAGFSVAHLIAEKGVGLFVCGKIGGNMKGALENKSIEFKEAEGKIEDVLSSI